MIDRMGIGINPGSVDQPTLPIRTEDRPAENKHADELAQANLRLFQANERLEREIADRTHIEEALGHSERKYRELYENLRDGCVAADLDGRIRECNSAYQRMLGYSLDELRGLRLYDVTPSKWWPIHEKMMREQLLPQGYSATYEKEYVRKDGAVFPIEVTQYLILDRSGVPAGFWGLVRDISDRRRAEDALREGQRRLLHAEKLAATAGLAAWIAHEVNNPLAGIKNMLRLLSETISREHVCHTWVHKLSQEIDRVTRIIRHMLDLQRPQEPTQSDVSIRAVVEWVVELLRPLSEARAVAVEVQADDRAARLPEDRVKQILLNLLINAIQASPPGECVTIEATISGDGLVFRVIDRGPGIPAEWRERVFEPFFSTKRDRSAADGGTGLGLSVCKNIAESLGATLDFVMPEGRGCVFRLVLPLFDSKQEA